MYLLKQALFDHKYVYVPATETVISTAPFPATQDVLAMAEDVTENGALLFATVAEDVDVQPFVPVTVTLYVPADKLLKSSVIALFDHKYVYVPATETVISTAPFPATQDVLATVEDVTENGALLFVTVAEDVDVQPFVPVTVTLYVPADRLLKSSVIALFDHKYVYVPATETVISTAPFPATQDVLGMAEDVTENGALLFVTVAEDVDVQPFAPVTVTLYVPADRLLKSSVIALFDHKYVYVPAYRNCDINRAVSSNTRRIGNG